jgi:hypothetical protein
MEQGYTRFLSSDNGIVLLHSTVFPASSGQGFRPSWQFARGNTFQGSAQSIDFNQVKCGRTVPLSTESIEYCAFFE